MKKTILGTLLLLTVFKGYPPDFNRYKEIEDSKEGKVKCNHYGTIEPFKLNRKFGFKNSVSDNQLDSIISYCNENCNFNPNIVITTIYRESCFNPGIKNFTGGPDLGLGQFVPCAIKYHNLDKDSICNPMYAVKAIILRYHDIIKKLHPKDDRSLVAAYGNYNRVRINDTKAITKSYNLFLRKEKELDKYKIKNR